MYAKGLLVVILNVLVLHSMKKTLDILYKMSLRVEVLKDDYSGPTQVMLKNPYGDDEPIERSTWNAWILRNDHMTKNFTEREIININLGNLELTPAILRLYEEKRKSRHIDPVVAPVSAPVIAPVSTIPPSFKVIGISGKYSTIKPATSKPEDMIVYEMRYELFQRGYNSNSIKKFGKRSDYNKIEDLIAKLEADPELNLKKTIANQDKAETIRDFPARPGVTFSEYYTDEEVREPHQHETQREPSTTLNSGILPPVLSNNKAAALANERNRKHNEAIARKQNIPKDRIRHVNGIDYYPDEEDVPENEVQYSSDDSDDGEGFDGNSYGTQMMRDLVNIANLSLLRKKRFN